MTILTKPTNEKKSEKLPLPLYAEGGSNTCLNQDGDAESFAAPRILTRRQRMNAITTIFLFLSALAVLCMGILGGVAIYRLYVPSQLERLQFHGFCGIPYDSQSINNLEMVQTNGNFRDSDNIFDPNSGVTFNVLPGNFGADFFPEEFELDLKDETYAKINVPEFKDGRRGRFIHDFKLNQSGIIDNDANRCFIMPLDRDTVLPPKSLYDLVIKMWSGYYNIDTERIRKNMRVVLPALTDMSLVSPKIAYECKDKNIYLLEKYVSGVFKRSVHLLDSGKFAEFSGKHIVEFDLVNIDEISALEKSSKAEA